jgi:prepilin-type N-terminal cleavage/methylation domain-containing protein
MNTTKLSKGFTLLELLIVIAIIAVLSVVLIVALNPAETLKKTRDSQRISDLSSLKTAIGIYTTSKITPYLDGPDGGPALPNEKCDGGTAADELVWVSATTDNGAITEDAPGTLSPYEQAADVTAAAAVDGTGWVPVDVASIAGGSPISNMPIDPTNDATAGTSGLAAITDEALMYRYACSKANVTFELNAKLESAAYTVDDAKATKDGGDNANLFETGTDLSIL